MTSPIAERDLPAVNRALTQAFGTTTLDAVAPIGGGLSGAHLFRIRVGGIAYLLRIDRARDELRDPARWHVCMQAAAQACLAPRVRYASAEDGVVIMDHVDQKSLALDFMGTRRDLLTEMAQTLRALHAIGPFPHLLDYLDAMDRLIGQFQAVDLFPAAAAARHLEAYQELAAVYRRLRPEPAPSHNDLNPGNILYDGARLWLVDWESAFQADRWFDLAAVANFFCGAPDEEETLLGIYLGAAPSPAQSARLFLARQVNHVFYAMVILNAAAAERPGVQGADGWSKVPPLLELHQRLGEGGPVLASWEGRISYGQAHLDEALAQIRGPRFAEAARLAA